MSAIMADVTIGVIKDRGMGTEIDAFNGSRGDTKRSLFGGSGFAPRTSYSERHSPFGAYK